MMIDEKNTINAGEVLAGDDAEISRLIKGLKRVNAPPDFNVRVRARIASGRPVETSTVRFPLFARYAAALSAVIVFAGMLGLVWLYTGDRNVGPTVAGPAPAMTQPQAVVPSNIVADVPSKTPGDDRAGLSTSLPAGPGRPQTKDVERDIVPPIANSQGGQAGSTTEARGEAKIVHPKGINPNAPRLQKPKEFDTASETPVTGVFSLLGIGAKYRAGAWQVDSVNASSSAERVGVKAGDVIEAVNDQTVKRTTSFKAPITFKTLQVKRGGQTIKISLIAE